MYNIDISLLCQICEIGEGIKYVELNNTVGQRWYIPLRNSNMHLSLFQPSSVKGKIVVSAFNIIKYIPLILHRINAKRIKLRFVPEFQAFVDNLFGCKNCTFGIFCGSPGFHQKPTLLIANSDKILGYCKLTDNPLVKKMFVKEKNNLDYLYSKGIHNVPKSLFCGTLDFCHNIDVFIQTTQRSSRIKIAKPTSKELIDFIKEWTIKTSKEILFEKSDFAKVLERLVTELKLIDNVEIQKIYSQAITYLIHNRSVILNYCAYHGDLTPWNSFITEGHFYAFDLEYFGQSYTPWCDYFHFYTQDMLYNNANADAKQIYHQYVKLRSNELSILNTPDFLYLAYLLVIADFYLNRDNGILNERIEQCFNVWSELITYLLYDLKKNHKPHCIIN